ncbi:MAG: glutamine--tRNA ligase/YqeY domain fusion protein [Sulfuriferula sp.]|nr:glutamine--tRNA ligase/YqeY domain fusion protein [Sulfuriferula sp.]
MSEPTEKPAISNFIRNIIDDDIANNKWNHPVTTRFPPEPNGYLHYGHAKSICLNFGLARDYAGVCHLRFDDTNPEKEEQEYVDSIIDAVRWLGFDWGDKQFFASDYFDKLYAYAEFLIEQGLAYVDSQSAEAMRENRGTHIVAGKNSPYRDRTPAENLDLFRRMKAGEFADGAHVLRAKIDMASPNFNLRDPVIYRIRHAEHHRTGNKWCIYPLYDYTHCISDALERITHSVCTLEFEDHRPLYDWVLDKLQPIIGWHPQQIEFARLNLTYVVLSKRKLITLVEGSHVDGWDDPRLPTLVGARRRGFTAAGFRLFTDRIGVSKGDSWIDMSILEDCMREDLNFTAERRIAVINPVKLIIDNYAEAESEICFAPNHPLKPELGKREIMLSRELWVEREDYMETPSKGYFRLFPGNKVRLRYGYVVECTHAEYDDNGNLSAIHCNYLPETKSGTAGADSVKVKGNIHWLSAAHASAVEVRLYDRLFAVPHPGADDRDYLLDINPDSKQVISAYIEPALCDIAAEQHFQFERNGYFVSDRMDSKAGAPVFNRTVTLKDTWVQKK